MTKLLIRFGPWAWFTLIMFTAASRGDQVTGRDCLIAIAPLFLVPFFVTLAKYRPIAEMREAGQIIKACRIRPAVVIALLFACVIVPAVLVPASGLLIRFLVARLTGPSGK